MGEGYSLPAFTTMSKVQSMVALAKVRFGSLADKRPRPKIRLCPVWSKSGHSRWQSRCPLCANSGHSRVRLSPEEKPQDIAGASL